MRSAEIRVWSLPPGRGCARRMANGGCRMLARFFRRTRPPTALALPVMAGADQPLQRACVCVEECARRLQNPSSRLFVTALTVVFSPPSDNAPTLGTSSNKGTVMNTKRNAFIGAVGIALLAFPSMASADFKPSAALFSACRSDAIKLCYGLMSMDAVASCLKSKRSATSARCRAQYDAETKVGLKK